MSLKHELPICFHIILVMDMDNREELIKRYYTLGLQQSEILAFLNLVHGIEISQRTLKRILKKLNLYRRNYYSNLTDVVKFIQHEISKSGQLHGYRWMHLKCLQNGFVVTQEIVRELLNILDPQGVYVRKRKRLRRRRYYNKGPNYVWHMDSYDKLKPYGICINGCIDGYSRHIIWLRAGSSSSNPKIIAGYFVGSMNVLGGYPRTIRSDMGTENKSVEKIQKALHELFNTNTTHNLPFIYGRSTANQRIESWWATLRKHNAQYWMNLFEILKDEGWFTGSFLDKSLIQYCFLEIIQVIEFANMN